MKPLETLIKLSKNKLEKLLLNKKEAEQNLLILETELSQILIEADEETRKYHNSEYAFILEKFLAEFRKKQNQYVLKINDAKRKIFSIEDTITFEFSELKKLEIALKNRQYQEAKKLIEKEIKSLDEYNIINHARNNR